MEISEVTSDSKDINIEGEVLEVGPVKTFLRMGRQGRVANAILKDDSGEIQLTLWNDQVDEVKKGDKVKIENGYVNEWKGNLQVSSGRNGTLEVQE